MNRTALLPPIQAIMLLWSTSGRFGDKESHSGETELRTRLEALQKSAGDDKKELAYLNLAGNRLYAALRNVEILYKGRELNYAENRIFRDDYLSSLKKSYDFSGQLKEGLKSLPAITIGGSGGIALLQTTQQEPGTAGLVFAGLLFAGIAFVLKELLDRLLLYNRQMNHIRQDYETTAYYEHYLGRVEHLLKHVAFDLNEGHRTIFGIPNQDPEELEAAVTGLIANVRPVCCHLVHKHIRTRKVNPETWLYCETGLPGCRLCKHFKEPAPGSTESTLKVCGSGETVTS